jgi:hypothetical protein
MSAGDARCPPWHQFGHKMEAAIGVRFRRHRLEGGRHPCFREGEGCRQSSLPLTQEIGDGIVVYINDGFREASFLFNLFVAGSSPRSVAPGRCPSCMV